MVVEDAVSTAFALGDPESAGLQQGAQLASKVRPVETFDLNLRSESGRCPS